MRLLNIFPVVAAMALAVSCGDMTVRKPGTTGSAYEVLVVCSQEKWDGPLGDTVTAIMTAPVDYLNVREPMFDVLRIMPYTFDGLITRHRNILILNSGPEFAEPAMTAQYDHYAAPQLMVSLTGPDDRSVAEYASEHRAELQAVFNMAERDRFVALARGRNGEKALDELVRAKFGFDISMPAGFTLRNDLEDFLWMSLEYPESSQGVVIYSYPYTGREVFSRDSLADRRDAFVSLIPGELPGSHMITYRGLGPLLVHERISGRYWAELRGFWDVKGDFMGGPFVSYSTLDTATDRVVTIDCYVYSPSPYRHKRNFLRQLENLIHTVSFPAGAGQ